jgi:hypothetical protein
VNASKNWHKLNDLEYTRQMIVKFQEAMEDLPTSVCALCAQLLSHSQIKVLDKEDELFNVMKDDCHQLRLDKCGTKENDVNVCDRCRTSLYKK